MRAMETCRNAVAYPRWRLRSMPSKRCNSGALDVAQPAALLSKITQRSASGCALLGGPARTAAANACNAVSS